MQQNLWGESTLTDEYKDWLRERGKSEGTIYTYTLNIGLYPTLPIKYIYEGAKIRRKHCKIREISVIDY